MVSGLPDYVSVVRPRYGGALGVTDSLAVTASILNTLVTIPGKGMVYGGFINLDYTSSQQMSELVLTIDEKTVIAMSFAKLNAWNLDVPRCFPIVLLKFDNTEYIYAAGIAYGLTFETEIKLQYRENHDTTPTIGYTFMYALL